MSEPGQGRREGTGPGRGMGAVCLQAWLISCSLRDWRLAQSVPSNLSSYLFKSRLLHPALPPPAAGCQGAVAPGATETRVSGPGSLEQACQVPTFPPPCRSSRGYGSWFLGQPSLPPLQALPWDTHYRCPGAQVTCLERQLMLPERQYRNNGQEKGVWWGQRDGSSHFLAPLEPQMPPLSLTSSAVGK